MYGLKHIRGIVSERRDVSGELWIVRVRPEEKISFAPGQYVTVGLPADSKLIERPYSVASSPEEGELEFFLEAVPGGKLSPRLYEVPVGGEVYVRPSAKGRFTFDDGSGNRNHFMVATVTGVAPFVGMIRSLAAGQGSAMPHQVAILHSASASSELGYRNELAGLAERYSWFEYIPTVSRPWLDPGWPGERGRVEDVARKYLDTLGWMASSATAYLCGNPHMIRNMEGILERAGFPKASVKEETYWPAS